MHLLGNVFASTTFPFSYILLRFRFQQCDLNTFHLNFIGVQCTDQSSLTVNTILSCNIVPMHCILAVICFMVVCEHSAILLTDGVYAHQKHRQILQYSAKCPEIPAVEYLSGYPWMASFKKDCHETLVG